MPRILVAAAAVTAAATLALSVHPVLAGETPPEEYADGLAGGPDFWAVTGVAANDTLNVRAGPSTGHDIKGELANGDVVRNLGCRMMGQSRWCHVKTLGEQSIEGWAAGRYLAEAARPEMATGEGRTLSSSDDPSKPDLYQRPSGEIEVNFKSGCGALYDADGTTITSGYSCTAEQLRAAEQAIAQSRK